MSKPLMLSIGGRPPEETQPAEETGPAAPGQPAAVQTSQAPAASAATPGAEPVAEIYQNLKRHEETLRDLIVEVRLLYYNLAEKERQRLETRREPTARQVQEALGGQVRALEEKIAQLRAVGK